MAKRGNSSSDDDMTVGTLANFAGGLESMEHVRRRVHTTRNTAQHEIAFRPSTAPLPGSLAVPIVGSITNQETEEQETIFYVEEVAGRDATSSSAGSRPQLQVGFSPIFASGSTGERRTLAAYHALVGPHASLRLDSSKSPSDEPTPIKASTPKAPGAQPATVVSNADSSTDHQTDSDTDSSDKSPAADFNQALGKIFGLGPIFNENAQSGYEGDADGSSDSGTSSAATGGTRKRKQSRDISTCSTSPAPAKKVARPNDPVVVTWTGCVTARQDAFYDAEKKDKDTSSSGSSSAKQSDPAAGKTTPTTPSPKQ